MLEVKPEAIDLMAQLAAQSQFGELDDGDEKEFEEQKQVALAKHRRALRNNLLLFQDGDIDAEEYYRQKDRHERQLTHWEAYQSDRQKLTLELTTCMELVKRLKLFWDTTTGEDRKLLARSLFDEIVYDLDARRMVDFKVQVWAEPFLMLRAELLQQNMDDESRPPA